MKKILFVVLFLLPVITNAQSSSSLPGEIVVEDHGKAQKFIIVTDEVARIQPDGRFQVQSTNISAVAKSSVLASDTRLVLYPVGKARTVANRRLLTEKILLQVQPGTDVASLAARQGNVSWEAAPALADHYVLRAVSAQNAIALVNALRTEPHVISAEFLLARKQTTKAAPNDPLFIKQWHLRNRGQSGGIAGIDANVVAIWGKFGGAGIRGNGVTIGIVDDGVQFTHPDIAPNYNAKIDYDWNDKTPGDASPNAYNEDFHGTSVAGVAAASGNNGIGVSGVAPRATLTGLRLIAGFEDDSDEAQAFLYRSDVIAIKNNSWGPNDDGQTMEAPGPLAQAALQQATTTGRNNRGTIFTWASGNGRQEGDASNYDGYANSIYTIAVTSISNNGGATYYGEPGANVIIGTPSDQYANSGIVTTDLVGRNGYNYLGAPGEIKDINYTQTFGGTSSATPIASGVVALMLQQNPRLGWRDVQEILIRTARKISPTQAGWITNAAGFHFNNNFGAGLINAYNAVKFAATWVNLTPQIQETQSITGPLSIPDGSGLLEQSFTFPNDKRVEHATVHLQITHPRRGDLRVILISPSGTVSELASPHNDPNSDIDWTYMSVRNWGENSGGVWRVQIFDMLSGRSGTLDSASVTLYGSAL